MKNSISLIEMDKHDSLAPTQKEMKSAVKKDELSNLIKQSPNRKFIGVFRIYLWFYNIVNPERMNRDIEKKKEKLVLKNEKRRAKGKNDKPYKKPWRQWFAEDIGEIPVVFDSSLARSSVDQIENYLYNKGFFNPQVSYEVDKDTLTNKAKVKYLVAPKIPYRINRIDFFIQNEAIEKIIFKDVIKKDSLIHHGDRFDLNDLHAYQTELNRNIRDHGYWMFNPSMVYFQADTNLNKYMVNLSLFVNDSRLGGNEEKQQSAIYYKRFYINNIYVNTSYPSLKDKNDNIIAIDTIDYRNKEILYQHRLRYNPKLFQRSMLIHKDSLFSVQETEITFKKLFELGSFDLVNISYNQEPIKDSSLQFLPLNAFINLNPAKNQSISFEGTSTNNDGNLGIAGSITYSHKNIFRGAEQLRISFSGGVEAQQSLDEPSQTTAYFNTIEVSPQIELIFPHFVAPFSYTRFKRILNPKTSIVANFNYQDRPDYQRTTTTSFFGYKWNSSQEINNQLNIVQVAYTKIEKTQEFQDYLDDLNNSVLEASYEDNVVPSMKYIGTFNNQLSTFQPRVFFTRFLLQEAGVLTRLMYKSFNGPENEDGEYLFNGIAFANFIKTEADMRFYNNFDENNALAMRFDIGSAWTLKNLDVLPFTDAFFVGGSNSNRAWRPRTLGPGSSIDSTGVDSYDKIGEIKLDMSLEYRFNLVSIIDLALFIDASNIWYMPRDGLTKDDPAVFNVNRFLGEIAIGSGFGVRLNFNFFLIRFDFGLQTKIPSAPIGERWIWQPKTLYNQQIDEINEINGSTLPYYRPITIFNLAIGYPF
jgi:outer membrane protein assembly factor BamA